MTPERIILGIDPGTIIMGYGLVRAVGQKAELLAFGAIHLNKLEDHYLRLKRIYDRVSGIIEEFKPDELAIEDLDATDGLAVALCHHFMTSSPGRSLSAGATKNWADFVRQNPDRIRKP